MQCALYYDNSSPLYIFFIIGVIIGVILAIIIWFVYIKIFYKNRSSENDSQLTNIDEKPILNQRKETKLSNINYDRKKLINLNFYEKENIDENSQDKKFIYYDNYELKKHIDYLENIINIEGVDLFSSDIIVHNKDVKSYYELDFQYMNDRVTGHMYLMQQLINFLYVNKLIDKEKFNHFRQIYDDKYRSEIDHFNENCQTFISDIHKSYTQSSQNIGEKESQKHLKVMEQLPPYAEMKINKMIQSTTANARNMVEIVRENEQLAEEDATKILHMYSKNSQNLEAQLSKYKQMAQLKYEERLKYFNSQLKNRIIDENITKDGYEQRQQILCNEILTKFDDLSVADKNQILKEYKENVNIIRMKNEEELNRQKQILEIKMKNDRAKEIEKAWSSRSMELNKTTDNWKKLSLEDGDRFLDFYQKTEENIDKEIFNIMKNRDLIEFEEFSKLKEKIDRSINTEITQLESKIIQQNGEISSLDSNKIRKIMDYHQRNVQEIERQLNDEKESQMNKMNEIIFQTNKKRCEELERGIRGQLDEEKKQEVIFKTTIDNQLILPQDLKNKILEDGKSNAIAVKNQMESLKIRQQKLMELELAKRMQQKAISEKVLNDKQLTSESTINKIDQIDRYVDIIQKFEQEKAKILLETRDKLVNETKEALKEKEIFLANIMAKYAISHARKMKKKKNLENLYQNIFNEINKKMDKSLSAKQIMDQYNNEKEYIEKQRNVTLLQQKEQLDKILKEKKEKIQNEKKQVYEKVYTEQLKEFQKTGLNKYAVDFVDSRFSDKIIKSVENDENEIQQKILEEAAMVKEQFDEFKFNKTLNNSTLETLSKLVDISNMSKSELVELIDHISPNIDENTKNQVLRELYRKQSRGSIKISKHDLNKFEKRNDYLQPNNYQKPFNEEINDDYNVNNNEIKTTRTKKKKKRVKNELIDNNEEEMEF